MTIGVCPFQKREVFWNSATVFIPTQPQLLPVEYGQGIADIGGHVRIEPVRTHHDCKSAQQPIAVGTNHRSPIITPILTDAACDPRQLGERSRHRPAILHVPMKWISNLVYVL
jgi:hypothetical protein